MLRSRTSFVFISTPSKHRQDEGDKQRKQLLSLITWTFIYKQGKHTSCPERPPSSRPGKLDSSALDVVVEAPKSQQCFVLEALCLEYRGLPGLYALRSIEPLGHISFSHSHTYPDIYFSPILPVVHSYLSSPQCRAIIPCLHYPLICSSIFSDLSPPNGATTINVV